MSIDIVRVTVEKFKLDELFNNSRAGMVGKQSITVTLAIGNQAVAKETIFRLLSTTGKNARMVIENLKR